jgi:hypothetical protein
MDLHLMWDRNAGKHVPASDITEVSRSGSSRKKNFRPEDLFLKGPIPWKWLVRAHDLPGKALIVGLCLWRLKGATGTNTIPLGNKELEPFGIDRAAKSRAIAELKRAGLIEVERKPGRWSTITLLM